MKNITVITAPTINLSARAVIRSCDCSSFDEEHIILVPDRFSLLAEKMVFDELDIQSTFNINVVGISRYANKVFDELNRSHNILTKQQSILLTMQAISNVKEQFVCFKRKITLGFAQEVYSTIAQLLSCQIKHDDLLESIEKSPLNLRAKMTDLALIMHEYFSLLGDKQDINQVLDDFIDCISKSQLVKKASFYFVGFNAFTKQGYAIFKGLIKFAKNVTIGIAKAQLGNAHIYDNDLYETCRSIAEEENISILEKNISLGLTPFQQAVTESLFSVKPNTKAVNGGVQMYSCSSLTGEVDALCRNIKILVDKGVRYNDISVTCNLSEYQNFIEHAFQEYNFAYYIDSATPLSEHCTAKYLINILTFFSNGLQRLDYMRIVKSQECGISTESQQEYENFLLARGTTGHLLLESDFNEEIVIFNNRLKSIGNKLCESKTGRDFADAIESVLEIFNIEKVLENRQGYFNRNNMLKEEKLSMLVLPAITDCLSTFDAVPLLINLDDFIQMLSVLFMEKKLSALPLSTDSIFIGDATISFFEQSAYMFVLGANNGELPFSQNDCGLISDRDIKDLSKSFLINPSIKLLNRRNKFALFETLASATQNIAFFYQTKSEGKNILPAPFIEPLMKSLNSQNYFNTDFDFVFSGLDSSQFENRVLTLCTTPFNALKTSTVLASTNEVSCAQKLKGVLPLQEHSFTVNKLNIVNAKSLFFSRQHTSVSQIETYYNCPFKHFINYGLRCKSRDTADFTASLLGSAIHRFAELFLQEVKDELQTLSQADFESMSINIANYVMKEDSFKYFFETTQNSYLIQMFRNETLMLAKHLREAQANCNFIPDLQWAEKTLKNNNVWTLKQGVSLIGKVDRVDVTDDAYRIIDYKTGKVTASLSDLYYGNKLQLFIYELMLEKNIQKRSAGVLYLPVRPVYDSETVTPFKMKGYLNNSAGDLHKMDTSVNFDKPKSKIVDLTISCSKDNIKTGEFVYLNSGAAISKSLYPKLKLLALRLAENAVEEMLQGFIQPKPFKDACLYCDYYASCPFLSDVQEYRKSQGKISQKALQEVIDGNI